MIRIGDLQFTDRERAAMQRIIDSGRISEGPEVRAFEDEFASYLGVKHCVAVSSGTAALMVGLQALIYDKRWYIQRIAIPALTFIATANAVKLCGLKPVFTDVYRSTFCMDITSIPWTQFDVALPVHLFGYTAKMAEIQERAVHRRALVVEDACESHGSVLDGQPTGTFGLWGAFSFYIAHTVQAGEMGCIVTNDGEIAEMCRRLKAHGRACGCRTCTRNTSGCPQLKAGKPDPRFLCLYPGYNFKPMEFQAAIARCQLEVLEDNIAARKDNFAYLNELLEGTDGLTTPYEQYGMVPMAYPLVLHPSIDRDSVVRELTDEGVECRPLFGCIPTQQPAYLRASPTSEFPVANELGRSGFYIGCHQYLTDEDIEVAASAVKRTVERNLK